MAIHFDKFANEGNHFLNKLASDLKHENELSRTGIILQAVLHTLRDSITVQESLHVISQLPMFLKGVYVENWTYNENPPRFNSKEEFLETVKQKQDTYGEDEFPWDMHTEEIVGRVLQNLQPYLTKGEAKHVVDQLPKEVKEIFEEALVA